MSKENPLPNSVQNDIITDSLDRIRDTVYGATKGLGEHELSFRPEGKGNSIAWLVWHLARVQDSHLSELLDNEDVWQSGGWHEKFGLELDPTSTGYGHSSNEVDMVQASEDLLNGYYDAVHTKLIEYVKGLKAEDYAEIVDPSWDPPVTLAVRLVSIVNDCTQHAGQAMYVRGLL